MNVSVKAHGDPRLREDMEHVVLEADREAWHTYSVDWELERVRFFVDEQHVRTVEQRIDYPLQLMVDVFEFPQGPERDPAEYPKVGEVRAVRGWRARGS